MSLSRLLIAGGLAVSLAWPLAAAAQQAPVPYGNAQQQQPGYPQQQQQPGYPQQQQPGAPAQRPGQNQTTPSAYQMQRQFGRQFQNLSITSQQQTQITSLINAYAQSHPEGSPRDRQAMKQLRQEILSTLTPAQLTQYEQERAQLAAQRAERRAQRLQQQGQNSPQQQGQNAPQQGQPPQQQPPPQYPGQTPPQGGF